MKKRLLNGALAVLMAAGVAAPAAQAVHVGYGVEFYSGGNYFTTVWSETVNAQWRVNAVRASVSKNGALSRSRWMRYEANVSRGGLGHARAFYDYY